MSLEQALQAIDALNQQVTSLTAQVTSLSARANSADSTHQQIHQELLQLRSLLATQKPGFSLIDPKTMKPEKLGSDKGPSWKQWSDDTRAFVENLSTTLAKLLKQVEGREEP